MNRNKYTRQASGLYLPSGLSPDEVKASMHGAGRVGSRGSSMGGGGTGGSGSGGGIDLYTPPTTASAYDDEFAADSLDAKWTAVGTVDQATAVDVDAAFADDEVRLDLDFRAGYLAAQNGSTGFNGITQGTEGVELTDGWFVINALQSLRSAQNVNNDSALYFGLYHTTSTVDAMREGVEMIIPEMDGGTLGDLNSTVVGAGTGGKALGNGEGLASYIGTFGLPFEFYAIRKTSDEDFDTWACSPGGTWHWLEDVNYTAGGTIDMLALLWSNVGTTAPGNAISLIGFVRHYSDISKFPPH